MKKVLFFVIFLSLTLFVTAQNGQPYKIFTAKGKKTSYKKMLKSIKKADIVLFGEHHNNSIIHWLQLQMTKDISNKRKLTLGAEMFESDNQGVLNDYLSGKIDKKALDTLARLWTNYKTDYKPLVDFAKDKKIKFIATNIPRRFARVVYKEGLEELDSFPEEDKVWIAPLPIKYDKDLPGYVKMVEMMGGHGGENFPKAQAIKDATMGYFIYKNLDKKRLFIHYNGSYHSDNFEAIGWYLKKYDESLNIITISTVEQKEIKKLGENEKDLANFIIVVPEDMTKTY